MFQNNSKNKILYLEKNGKRKIIIEKSIIELLRAFQIYNLIQK